MTGFLFHHDGLGQLLVDVVAAILDGHGAAASAVGNHRDRLTAVAAQREQKRIELLIVCLYGFDDVFLAFYSIGQIHICHQVSDIRD